MNQTNRPERMRGFSLVELIIVVSVLAILAALVIPKFTDASTLAQTSAVKDTLRGTRVALEKYKFEHHDTYPQIDDLWAALTQSTDKDGTLNDAGVCGPYIKNVPINPFTSSSTVVAFGAGGAGDGWEYDPTQQPPLIAVGFDESTDTFTSP